jgi:hypothetical protein
MEVFKSTKYRFYALLRVGMDPSQSRLAANCLRLLSPISSGIDTGGVLDRTYAADFLIQDELLAVVHTDDLGNLSVLDYDCYGVLEHLY